MKEARDQARAARALKSDPRGPGRSRRYVVNPADQVKLSVLSDDGLSALGVISCLTGVPGLCFVPRERSGEADAVLLVAAKVTGEVLQTIKAIHDESDGARCIVLVADIPGECAAVTAVMNGATSILPRSQVTAASLARTLQASLSGELVIPRRVVARLVERSRQFELIVREEHGITGGGLTLREAAVLRMLADGLSTAEISQSMNYAERTIKNVIQDVLARTGARSRTQAVAYAMRMGAI